MTNDTKITLEDVQRAAQAMMLERGSDYIYPLHHGEHRYVHNRGTQSETPGCAVGWIYHHLLGTMVPEAMEGYIVSDQVFAPVTKASEEFHALFTEDAIRWLAWFQSYQDLAYTYGECLDGTEQALS